MRKIKTELPEVCIIEPDVYTDERGFFFESYSYKKYKKLGIDWKFVQDNHSRSLKNTVRGLHFQAYPGQVKLIRCVCGKIWDVVIDIRPQSPNFKKWVGTSLSAENYLQILIPVGFAHGFSVLSDYAEIEYKVSNYYDPSLEREVYWNDPSLNIDWKVKSPILSQRDVNAPLLDEYLKQHKDPFE
ncbi:MAG: dTDP-4-dehydrorhamnose 3,5-epimerase [Candidatus Lokiarchaeota archaeon]|nr:dTDP-4-dehydrorhamnose 3,5-epimerase [Candidatus Lokiarchaeota archaeon]MBD3339370.1 dTDP-4-dehydrorhamnose 3,5-epimerase [Candidatus Lokiarchaeota archaeon]